MHTILAPKIVHTRLFKTGLIISFVILAAIAFVFFRQAKATKAASSLVAHTHEVLFRSEKLFAVITNSETSSRGYLLTGLDDFFEDYGKAKMQLHSAFEVLGQLTKDNEQQQQHLKELQAMVVRRTAVADSMVLIKKQQATLLNLKPVIENNSAQYLDYIRLAANEIEGHETKLLQLRKIESSKTEGREYGIFITVIIMLLVLMVLVFVKETQLTGDTQRKKSGLLFKALLECAPEVLIIVNLQREIMLVNHKAEVLFGYSKEELVGQNLGTLIPGKLWQLHFDAFKSLATIEGTKHMVNGIEMEAIKKDRSRFPVEASFSPISGEAGTLVIASIRDLTALKKASAEIKNLNASLEEKVFQRTEELRAANSEMEAFTYSVSHDLRSPLRGIIGFTSILEDDYASQLDDEARRLTGIIKYNTNRMGHLIDDLLSFSRMARQEIVKCDTAMASLVSETIAELQGNNHNIEWDIAELPAVNADPATIKQVWCNLISNAIKYSKKSLQPKIKIGWQKMEGQKVYFIKDNGVGFDIKYKEKLFKVFQRLHAATEFEGTGVGLAIVEKIVSKHGGKIWADAVLGQGACFYFSLPDNDALHHN